MEERTQLAYVRVVCFAATKNAHSGWFPVLSAFASVSSTLHKDCPKIPSENDRTNERARACRSAELHIHAPSKFGRNNGPSRWATWSMAAAKEHRCGTSSEVAAFNFGAIGVGRQVPARSSFFGHD